ncbi:TPA: hypothetical protein KKX35_003211 [Legionella pneumophila]|nr:hypothetical protein [Legionella pneumophila]HAU0207278.1 hypothetical protein [Legionella pneumophila]HAU0279799.1 hypothetical protein [Legionella pneumophila]HAU1294291.1 hypothetical protein [Legionella pneumophila]HAU1331802.1 hypothetical protein [Legionella pneumophila]
MPDYGLTLFSDRAKSAFEYGNNEKVTVLAFQTDINIQFPTINPKIHDRAQPGSTWSEELQLTNPTLMAKTMRSLYSTIGAFGANSTKALVHDKNIFYHSIAETIQKRKLDCSEQIKSDLAQSQKVMICAHGYPDDTDNAYLVTASGDKFSISYEDLAKLLAGHISILRKEPLIIDLSMCYAARSANQKKVHTLNNISKEDIDSSFSHKFTKKLSELLPNTPLQIKASATAVTYDYSSGLRMTELEEYFQDTKGWSSQHRGEDYFAPETLSFSHYADPEKGLYTKVTETDNDEQQTTLEFIMETPDDKSLEGTLSMGSGAGA